MCTADMVLGKAELTKPVTWACESERSTVSADVDVAGAVAVVVEDGLALEDPVLPAPDALAALALGAVEDLADGLEHGLEPVLVHQLEQPSLADARRPHHRPQVALEVARVPHVGGHHLQHVVAQLAPVVQLERGDPDALLPDLGGARVVGAVGRAADVVLVGAVDRPEHRPVAHEDREQHREVGQVIVAVVGVVQEEQVARGDPPLEEVGHRRHRPGQGAHVDGHMLGLRGEPTLAVEYRGGEVAARVQDLRVGGAQHGLAHLLHDGLEAMLDHRDGDSVGAHGGTSWARVTAPGGRSPGPATPARA
jgi:hypothetical protein